MLVSFLSLPWYLSAPLFVFGCVASALIGLALVRYHVSTATLESNQKLGPVAFNIIGVLYALLLGFTVLNAQNHFNEVHQTIDDEASLVADLFRDCVVFDPLHRDAIRAALQAYVKDVIEHEWSLLAKGDTSVELSRITQHIWHLYARIEPANEKQKIWYGLSLTRLNELNNARLLRLYHLKKSLGNMMWTLLIAGAISVTSSVYFFYCPNKFAHMLMTALIVGNISFMLFLTISLDHPFIGDQGIKPVNFQRLLTLFERWETEPVLN